MMRIVLAAHLPTAFNSNAQRRPLVALCWVPWLRRGQALLPWALARLVSRTEKAFKAFTSRKARSTDGQPRCGTLFWSHASLWCFHFVRLVPEKSRSKVPSPVTPVATKSSANIMPAAEETVPVFLSRDGAASAGVGLEEDGGVFWRPLLFVFPRLIFFIQSAYRNHTKTKLLKPSWQRLARWQWVLARLT